MKDVKAENPSPLQKKVINTIKKGGDLLVHASSEEHPETGYLVPVLDHIARQDRREGTKALILTESAERTAEIDTWIRKVGAHAEIVTAVIDPDMDKSKLRSALSAGPSIIVANPAELAGLMEEHRMIFRESKFLILDRVDQFENPGVVDVINKRIIGSCQHIATVNRETEITKEISAMLDSIFAEYETIRTEVRSEVEKTKTNGEEITIPKQLTQYYIKVPPRMKISTLMSQLKENSNGQALIFTASRRTADRLYRVLRKNDMRAVSLHSDLDEATSSERLGRFTSGNVQHLIAGEMSASDLPAEKVTRVINYDVPEEVAEYKLRADLLDQEKETKIISLVSKQDRSDISEIIEQLGYAPEEIPLPESVGSKKSDRKESSEQKPGKGKAKQTQQRTQNRNTRETKRTEKQKQRSEEKRVGKKKKRPGSLAAESPKVGAPEGLPRPSYDKLKGGRSGREKDRPDGIVGFFKKLFS